MKKQNYIYNNVLCTFLCASICLHLSTFSLSNSLENPLENYPGKLPKYEYPLVRSTVSFSVTPITARVNPVQDIPLKYDFLMTDQMIKNLSLFQAIAYAQEQGSATLVPIKEIHLNKCPEENYFTFLEQSISDIKDITGLDIIPFNCKGLFLSDNQQVQLTGNKYVQGVFLSTPDDLYYISFKDSYLYRLGSETIKTTIDDQHTTQYPYLLPNAYHSPNIRKHTANSPMKVGVGYHILTNNNISHSNKISYTADLHNSQNVTNKHIIRIPVYYQIAQNFYTKFISDQDPDDDDPPFPIVGPTGKKNYLHPNDIPPVFIPTISDMTYYADQDPDDDPPFPIVGPTGKKAYLIFGDITLIDPTQVYY